MLPNDTYSQPDAADPILEARTVLDLVRRHGVPGVTVTVVDETGGEARAYMVEPGVVVKMQRPHRLRPRTSLAKEAFILQQIAAASDLVVPQVLGSGQHHGVDYLVLTRMPGVPARTVTLTDAQRTAVLHQLGRTLRRLHTLPQAPFMDSAPLPGPRTRQAFVTQVEANVGQAVQVIEATTDLWPFEVAPGVLMAQWLTALPARLDLVALHSNPGPEHTFIDPETRAFIGLIDFGDAYIGHPALEWRWPTPTDHLALLEGYGADTPLTDEFLAAWRALVGLNALVMLATRPASRPQTLARLRAACTTAG